MQQTVKSKSLTFLTHAIIYQLQQMHVIDFSWNVMLFAIQTKREITLTSKTFLKNMVNSL